jgi:hypothetical protein
VHLYWRNADHELIHQKFYGDGFDSYAENVTAGWPHVGPALNIVDGLTAVIRPDGASQHVFGKNVHGELVHYYWSAQGGWTAEDLTSYPNIGRAYTFN